MEYAAVGGTSEEVAVPAGTRGEGEQVEVPAGQSSGASVASGEGTSFVDGGGGDASGPAVQERREGFISADAAVDGAVLELGVTSMGNGDGERARGGSSRDADKDTLAPQVRCVLLRCTGGYERCDFALL